MAIGAEDRVLTTNVLQAEIVSFLDIRSLGVLEQVNKDMQRAALVAWRNLSKSLQSEISTNNVDDYKEQVRRHLVAATFTSNCIAQHRRHFLRSSAYIRPRSEPQCSSKCGGCRLFPKLNTNALQDIDRYAYFVSITHLTDSGASSGDHHRQHEQVLERFLPIGLFENYDPRRSSLQLDIDSSSPCIIAAIPPLEPNEMQRERLAETMDEESRTRLLAYFRFELFREASESVLSRLELTVTALDKETGAPSLVLATGGGELFSHVLEPRWDLYRTWRMWSRLDDSHAGRSILSHRIFSALSFQQDYRGLEYIQVILVT